MTARISPAGFRVALLSLLVAGSAAGSGYDLSVPVRTGDRIDGHYVWSVEGLGPDSLTDAGEIAFIDLYVDQIPSQGALSSLRRGADVGDLIGGVAVSEFKAGFQAAIDGNGTIGFQALSQGLGDLVFVLPGFALPNLAAQVGAATTTAGSHPAANELGDSAFAFNWCNEANCPRRWIGEPAGALLADEFMQDGFQITDFDVPALNEQGDVAFVASHMDGLVRKKGVYLYDRLTTTTLFREGDVIDGGTVGRQCCPSGLDLDDAGRVAVMWLDADGARVLIVGDAMVLREGDTVEGIEITFLPDTAIPSINGAGAWALYAVLDAGFSDAAIVTASAIVARVGETVAGDRIDSLWGPSVNESGQVAFQARFGPSNFSPSAAILATPTASNARVRLTASSPASIRQTVTAPAGATDVRFGHRFETTTGALTVRFAGQTIGTVPAPATPSDAYDRARFLVDGALLGQTGDLELVLDGPAGSRVWIDDVVFPSVANGHFQDGGTAGWQSSGDVALFVPEPRSRDLQVACVLVLFGLARRR